VEVHLLDFQGDLYGCHLRVFFQTHLRGERRFPSADALAEAIRRDVGAARELPEPALAQLRPFAVGSNLSAG
jgi:riboflavin kinase/FMN adenylyltransferase